MRVCVGVCVCVRVMDQTELKTPCMEQLLLNTVAVDNHWLDHSEGNDFYG